MQQLEERVRLLERKLAAVSQERDSLKQDLETVCLQNSSSRFGKSYVLTERVTATDAELKDTRAKAASLTREKEQLQDDLCAMRIAKSAAEHLSQQQHLQLEELEKDLQHYQVQLSRAVTQRDQALLDTEHLRTQVSELEEAAKQARRREGEEAATRAALEQQLAGLQERQQRQQQQLETKCTEWEEARMQLRNLNEEKKRSDGAFAALQAKVVLLQSDLERTQMLLRDSHQAEARFRVKLQEAVSSSAQLQGTASGQAEMISRQHEELSTLQAQVADWQREAGSSFSELARSRARLLDLEQQVEAQRRALEEESKAAQAEQRHLQLEVQHLQQQLTEKRQKSRSQSGSLDPGGLGIGKAAAGSPGCPEDDVFLGHSGVGEDQREQMEILTQMVWDLKIKLAQATQEKVEALMKIAAADPPENSMSSTKLGGDWSTWLQRSRSEC